VAATIRYDVADPYAVHVSFHTGADGSTVEWSFARQLLADGATHPSARATSRCGRPTATTAR
jgi:hypothetical protein